MAALGVQGNVRVQKTSTSKGAKNRKAPKADSEAEKKFDTFHPFGTKLPRELVAMILEQAADCAPAIAYVHCKVDKHDALKLVLTNGKEGSASKFKEMVRLAKLFPNFQSIIERRFGLPLDENFAKHPALGIRKEKDLMVFSFQKDSGMFVQFFNWVLVALLKTNRTTLAPGIRNVGVRFSNSNCRGAVCYGCKCCVQDAARNNSCAWELASFCQNLSDADSIFILVLLEGHDVVGGNTNKHASLMKALIANSKSNDSHASFEDRERTWVEVSRQTPCAIRKMIRPGLLRPIFTLCNSAQDVNDYPISRLIGAEARRHVRFRVLVSSRWKNATLKI
ncbi:hypothetical protein LZ30DRAFT_653981 [Colletotrichum cereale]|nr:hypothetical protein LZ30DRAFT_653981 [Colletotrichum cereale]